LAAPIVNHTIKPKDRPVVILSAGRSGSTLLQKLLNSHEDLVIWGEHDGLLNLFMRSWKAVCRSRWIPENEPQGAWLLEEDRPLNVDKWTAWDGSFSKQDFNKYLKRFIDNLFCENVPDDLRWGFKEIRYRNIDFMDFWSDFYPETQYILLMRNPIDSCLSFAIAAANAQKNPATEDEYVNIMSFVAEKQIKPIFNFFSEAMTKFDGAVHAVIFENLVDDTAKVIDDIDNFLMLESRFDSEKVSKIIQKDIVSQRTQTSLELKQKLREKAKPLLEKELEWFKAFVVQHRDTDVAPEI
jgi:hypothetical protein